MTSAWPSGAQKGQKGGCDEHLAKRSPGGPESGGLTKWIAGKWVAGMGCGNGLRRARLRAGLRRGRLRAVGTGRVAPAPSARTRRRRTG
eukprot:3731682-Prymnesium_polylepis.1